MKKIFFPILVLAVLAAIGAGLFLYFSPPSGTTPGEESGFQEFSPLDISGDSQPKGEEAVVPGEGGLEEILIPSEETPTGAQVSKINKVTDRAVAGISSLYDKDGNLLIYYVDQSSGNVYRRDLNKEGIFGAEERLTTTIIPSVHEAFFVSKNSKVILRYAKEDSSSPSGFIIETFLGNMPASPASQGEPVSPDTNLQGVFLEENIADLSVSPDTNKLFYLVSANGKISGINYDLVTNKKTQIFSSDFTDWLSQYINTKSIILTVKASQEVPGSSYLLDIISKNYSKIVGDSNGLTALGSPSGKLLLYGGGDGALNIFDLDKKSSTPLGLNSLSEKCVWSKDNTKLYCAVPDNLDRNLPDDWYKGLTSFNDGLWRANLSSGATTAILENKDLPTPVDMVNLKLDERGNYLFFTDKKDNALWVIDLRI